MSAAQSKEEVSIVSMIDLAGQLLREEKKPLTFYEIFDRVAEQRGLSEDEKEQKIAQLYTEINVDGRFLNVGDNLWGLKRWYPVERVEDELTGGTKKKAKKAKEAKKAKKAKPAVDEDPKLDEELDIDVDEIDEVLDEDELLLKEDDLFDDDLEEVDIDEDDMDLDDEDDFEEEED